MTDQGYKWRPIEDLPEDWQEIVSDELRALAGVWREQVLTLKDLQATAVREFNERLRREWAIETGIIERLYDMDRGDPHRGTTQLLIEQGIDASLIEHGTTDRPAEVVVAIIEDHHQAVDGLFDFVASRRPLSTSYVKELHQVLTTHQETAQAANSEGRMVQVPLRRGDWKQWPNNPTPTDGSVHEYCPPEQVDSEMDKLIEMHLAHQEAKVPPEVEAAWLHHRFSQIHPFQDGNGRVARCLATVVFLRAHQLPLVVKRDDRDEYIRALEAADRGSLSDLVALFVSIEKRAFLQALRLSEEVATEARLQDVISAAAAKIKEKREEQIEKLRGVFHLGEALQGIAGERMESLREELVEAITSVSPSFNALVSDCPDEGEFRYWFRWQVIQAARQLDYFADLRTHHSWVRLILREADEPQTEVLVSFHSLGREFRGVLACSVLTFRKEQTGEEGQETTDVKVACREVFQFNYLDAEESVKLRFAKWLDESLVVALEDWRKQL